MNNNVMSACESTDDHPLARYIHRVGWTVQQN